MDPQRFLEGLNDEQRAAAQHAHGPVVIHAGAGTGKTRVISHRAAYAAATGAMDPGKALLVTFTDKAAGELGDRVRHLGVPGVAAMTFHKAAWRQLRHFWPTAGGGELTILSQPWRIVAPAVRRLPGHYRFTPTQDVLDTISWLATSRVPYDEVEAAAARDHRVLPLPDDLLLRVVRHYRQAKDRDGLVDFDDMILRTTDLLRDRPDVLAQVRDRYAWFSVDEFQDTNPAQFDLLRLWLGDRDDVCVVGDDHQTIYTFTGATARFLLEFDRHFPGAASYDLTTNYRSTPQVLGLANRVIAARRPLLATVPGGPEPVIAAHDDTVAETGAVVTSLRDWHDAGVDYREMAVLVRLNADIPAFESACTLAGIPFVVRGTRFFDRREIAAAVRALERGAAGPGDETVGDWFAGVLHHDFGYEPDDDPGTPEARERHEALGTLLALVRSLAATTDSAGIVAELRRRAEHEREHQDTGVTLATLHRAKGLEWDAVCLPGLEEGHLPVQQAVREPDLVAEERRLLYVGITRARRFLTLSWSRQREGAGGKPKRAKRSRFLPSTGSGRRDELAIGPSKGAEPRSRRGGVASPSRGGPNAAVVLPSEITGGDPLYEALKAWRLERARADAVPAYVVFSNSTLALIARLRPTSRAELAAVNGVGPAKLDRYGAEVLAVTGQHAADPS